MLIKVINAIIHLFEIEKYVGKMAAGSLFRLNEMLPFVPVYFCDKLNMTIPDKFDSLKNGGYGSVSMNISDFCMCKYS